VRESLSDDDVIGEVMFCCFSALDLARYQELLA